MDRLPLVVNLLKAEDALRWDAFVQRCPQATFFHLSAWRDIMEEVFDHRTFYLYAERAGEIVGILPLAEVRSRLFGHSLTSLPFCVYGGIAAADDAGLETEHALEAKADTLAQALGVQHLEYRNLQLRHEDWPRQELYVTFRKAILAEPEANMLAIPRKQRAMVRKGIKNGLVSEIDHDLERFFALYADNVLRHGTPALPKKFFERLKHSFGEACEVLTVTSPEGKPLSSVLSFYFRDEVLPYYAGDDFSARDLAANDFKYWELMRRACERGCKIFDYGRSKVGTGPYAFKKNWGFEPQPLSYEFRLYKRDTIPQNNPMNPRYRAFIALWKRLPIGVANRLGPHIVRNLG
ncbi:FemAB family XrtA/PEP-CTERM system-associated protein [Thauera sp.]|uniref:FemAB family XrtA/PEP-CTERM system-associated protein n=1 Tax=Thauera sp. TaxID=1905334 RepID=UPI0026326831|nr:FemAB family XrtA/PEP-CTERM system-associated protein [Thauera sp.]